MINISFGYKQQAIIKFTWAHNAICAETERVKNTVSVIRRPLVCFMDLLRKCHHAYLQTLTCASTRRVRI